MELLISDAGHVNWKHYDRCKLRLIEIGVSFGSLLLPLKHSKIASRTQRQPHIRITDDYYHIYAYNLWYMACWNWIIHAMAYWASCGFLWSDNPQQLGETYLMTGNAPKIEGVCNRFQIPISELVPYK